MRVLLIVLLLFRFVGYHFWLPFLALDYSKSLFVSPAADLFDNLVFTKCFAVKQAGLSVIDHPHFIV